jgi:hypothetical protein
VTCFEARMSDLFEIFKANSWLKFSGIL